MTYGNYPDLSTVKRVLVIKTRHLGDVLLTSPLFTLLKKAMPQAQIDAYIYKESLPMLEGHPAISSFLLYDRSWKKNSFLHRLRKEASLFKEVRSRKYDLVINLTEGDRGAWIARLSGSAIRVGVKDRKKMHQVYTHTVKGCSTPRHMVELHLDFLRCIGIFPSPVERELQLAIPPNAIARVDSLLERCGLQQKGYIVIHPVSRWLFKCPPPAFFARLITALARQGHKILLTAGSDAKEKEFIQAIVTAIPSGAAIDLSGALELKELAALISLSRGLLTVDSLPLHLASACKTPVVVLFGPSSEAKWGPWLNPRSRVVFSTLSCRPCLMDGCGGSKMSDCLSSLSEDAVLMALSQVL